MEAGMGAGRRMDMAMTIRPMTIRPTVIRLTIIRITPIARR